MYRDKKSVTFTATGNLEWPINQTLTAGNLHRCGENMKSTCSQKWTVSSLPWGDSANLCAVCYLSLIQTSAFNKPASEFEPVAPSSAAHEEAAETERTPLSHMWAFLVPLEKQHTALCVIYVTRRIQQQYKIQHNMFAVTLNTLHLCYWDYFDFLLFQDVLMRFGF